MGIFIVSDVWSRKLVGWAVHDVQSVDLAAQLAEESCRREGVEPGRLVLLTRAEGISVANCIRIGGKQ